MPSESICPAPELLERFMAGLIADADARTVEVHLESCDQCVETLNGLQADDSLVEAAQGSPESSSGLPAAAVDELVDRIQAATTRTVPKPARSTEADAALILSQLAPAEQADELGRLGNYRVLAILGSGGMGMVFRAEDRLLKREVALKLMRPGLAAEAKQRFLREARAMAALQHDHVVAVFQVGEERDMPFLAMQYLKGMSLADWFKTKPPLTVPQILKLGREVALGLAAAHQKGLVHRDIKPANLWLEAPKGRVKILDFGLVKPEAETELLTQSGGLMGTPAFMSPEQASSEPLDARSDLFSLGGVLYQACTGQQPFAGERLAQVINAVLNKEPAPIQDLNPSVSPDLANLVMKLLAKRPEDRPSSAKEVAAQFECLMKQSSAVTPSVVEPVAQPKLRRPSSPWPWLVAGAAFLLLAGGLWWGGQVVFTVTDDKGKQVVITIPEPPPGTSVAVHANGREVGTVATPRDSAPTTVPALPRTESSPFEAFQRTNLTKEALVIAGGGDPAQAPAELVAVWGDGRLAPWAPPQAVAFLPGGKQLVSAGQDHLVTLWNAENGLPVHRFHASGAERNLHFEAIAVSPDGATLAACGSSRDKVTLWDLASRRELRKLALKITEATALAFQPQGPLLAVGGKDGTIRLWNYQTGEMKQDLKGHIGWIRSLAFSPDGTRLVSGSQATGTFHLLGEPGQVKMWDATTGKPLHSLGNAQFGFAVAVCPASKLVAGGGSGGKIQLWNLETGAPVRALQAPWDKAYGLSFTPDAKRLVASGSDDSVRVFSVETGAEVRCLTHQNGRTFSLATADQGQLLAGADHSGRVRLWNGETGEERFPSVGHRGLVKALALLSSDTWATAGYEGTIFLWSVDSRVPKGQLEGHRGLVGALAHHRERGLLASAGDDGTVRLWDPVRRTSLRTLDAHAGSVRGVGFTPDGSQCVSIGDDSWTQAWDPATGQLLWSVRHPRQLRNLAIGADGLAVLADEQGHVAILDPKQQGRLVADFPGGKGGNTALACNSSGLGLVATGCAGLGDHALRCFRVRSGDLLATCAGHDNTAYALAFNAPGSLLASASVDGNLGLWSPHTGKLLRQTPFASYGAQVHALCFAADGRHLLMGNGNGTIYLLRLPASAQP